MKQYLDKATDINEQEGLFGMNNTNYPLKNQQKVLEN